MHWLGIPKSQRSEQLHKCGTKCYLLSSELKFPVCNKNCSYSRAGIQAAFKRAREWKYEKVATKAKNLLNKMPLEGGALTGQEGAMYVNGKQKTGEEIKAEYKELYYFLKTLINEELYKKLKSYVGFEFDKYPVVYSGQNQELTPFNFSIKEDVFVVIWSNIWMQLK